MIGGPAVFSAAQTARIADHLAALQDRLCRALEAADGVGRFREDRWQRSEGGGGVSRVLEDGVTFEKGAVNYSEVFGALPEPLCRRGGWPDGTRFWAAGVSVILHPRSPRVPTVHANFRAITEGSRSWFGGGVDLTPFYLDVADARHFHHTLRAACERHDPSFYPRFKAWCDTYFYLPHRGEARGIGGLFFDELEGSFEPLLAFFQDVSEAFLPAYLPIVERRRDEPYGDRERTWQMQRRSRYVEFNLMYDRGTRFGLETGGRVESILLSLPPVVRNDYQVVPEPGSAEDELLRLLCSAPRDWGG